MTPQLAVEYIPILLRDFGYGKKYHLDLKHFVLQDQEKIKLKAFNCFYILVEEPEHVSVASQMGIFDLKYTETNELKYVHTGQMVIKNTDPNHDVQRIRFIKVIPYK